MRKKLLAVLLALALVLAFSGMAMAYDNFSVEPDAGSGKVAAIVPDRKSTRLNSSHAR